MIRNCDGTPYQLAGDLALYDPTNPDLSLMNSYDEELFRLGGSPLLYYECLIQPQTTDPLYREDRGKLFSPVPVQLYAMYEPIPAQNYQNMFGIDGPDSVQFELNYQAVLRAIGHPPKIGSRVRSLHLDEDWVIVQRNPGEFRYWGAFHVVLICSRFQDDVVTGAGNVPQAQPDVKLNSGFLLGDL